MIMQRRHLLAGGAAALGGAFAGRGARAQAKGTVRIAYVEWADAIVATNIAAAVLQQAGYKTDLTPTTAAAMWQAVASGDADCMLAAWLPATHAAYYAKLKDQVDMIGPNVSGAKIGWAVPQYSKLKSIGDLKTMGGDVDNKVIGIDPGAGLMRASEKTIKEYGLDNITLVDGSDATMTAALKDAVTRNKDIVVTSWTPHWMWAAYKLKYLEDPKGTLGGEETVNTVARKGLKADMPGVYDILSRFKLSLGDEQSLMLENEKPGADPAKTAKAWISSNPAAVKTWLG